MKRILLCLFFILILLLCFFLWDKRKQDQNIAPKNLTVSEIKFSTSPLNLKISTDYDLKKKQTISFHPDEDKKKSIVPTINFGKCHSFVEKPDSLLNRLKKQTGNKTETENNIYQIDCGIIQTTFPLSF